jgi:hypothetical protein
MDAHKTPPELLQCWEPNSSCIKRDLFLYFLEQEVARASRYQFFVSLLLFQLQKNYSFLSPALADHLSRHLRKSDYVGTVRRGTLGTILLNSKLETSLKVMERLRSDFVSSVTRNHPQVGLRVSSTVYPTEANTLGSLYDTALKRLCGENNRFMKLAGHSKKPCSGIHSLDLPEGL